MTRKPFILVSGGTGGIGSALCRLLPASGFTPIIGYNLNQDQAESLARECGGFAVNLDLCSDESIALAIAHLSQEIGADERLGGVVLAGSPPPELLPFGRLKTATLLHQLRVNVVGPQLLLAGLIRIHFRKNKSGVVVGVLSEAMGSETRLPATSMGAYVIAKTALHGLLSVSAAEYPWLRVRSISPGFTKTRMLDVFDERYLAQMQEKKQFASPADVARLILNKILL